MRQLIKTEGIVLQTYPFRDSDLVVRVLTPDFGKLGLIARGSRKSQRRFSSRPDVFDLGTFEFVAAQGRSSLATLRGFNPRGALSMLRSDLQCLTAGSLLCETLDCLIPEDLDLEDRLPYDILLNSLRDLNQLAGDLRGILRRTCIALGEVLEQSGFVDPTVRRQPGTHQLLQDLKTVEEVAERELRSKLLFIPMVESFKETTGAEREISQ